MIHNLLRGSMPFLIGAALSAQVFNVDISVNPSLAPTSSFGGYPPQTGVWNSVAVVGAPQTLSTIAGVPSNTEATFLTVPGAGTQSIPIPAYRALYEDFATSGPGAFQLEFDDLDIGRYVAVVYSWKPWASTFFRMQSNLGTVESTGIVTCPPSFPPTGYVVGQTLTLLPFEIYDIGAGPGTATLEVLTDSMSALNGVQLVRYVGDSGCPQGANSLGQNPQPIAVGTIDVVGGTQGISVAANDLRIQVGLLPDSSLPPIGSILCFVSNDNAANAAYTCPFIGTRCIGLNSLARVSDPNAPVGSGGAGMTTAQGTYELPINFAILAAQGINVTPGSTLHFQFVYRDLDGANTCGGGAMAPIARWTNSISVLLVP